MATQRFELAPASRLAVAGGLAFSQLMTLYLTPVVYTYMAGIVEWWRRGRAHAVPEPLMGTGD